VKVGVPLALLVMVLCVALVPLLLPLFPQAAEGAAAVPVP
jgi:di/tricarboxylate transporter